MLVRAAPSRPAGKAAAKVDQLGFHASGAFASKGRRRRTGTEGRRDDSDSDGGKFKTKIVTIQHGLASVPELSNSLWGIAPSIGTTGDGIMRQHSYQAAFCSSLMSSRLALKKIGSCSVNNIVSAS